MKNLKMLFRFLMPAQYVCLASIFTSSIHATQFDVPVIDMMPNDPTNPSVIPLLINWSQQASNYDAYMFNAAGTGTYQPTMWWDDSYPNLVMTTFGFPSYIGENSGSYPQSNFGDDHEAIACMSAVVGGALVGINETNKLTPYASSNNFAAMCEQYFNSANGQNVFLDVESDYSGYNFWYDFTPNLLAAMLYSIYGDNISPTFGGDVYTAADQWFNAEYYMGGYSGIPNFSHDAWKLQTMTPYDAGHPEPDSAAGIACFEYWAYTKWPAATQHLTGAQWGMQYLSGLSSSPYYESLLPWGAYTAARMNAEQGDSYPVTNFVNWCFSGSTARHGWGVITNQWGAEDCYGLVGSQIDDATSEGADPGYPGYAFAMNTFSQAAALVPMVRYDYRFSTAIGKWMLNLCHAARLFYPNYISPTYQDCWGLLPSDTNYSVAYEGLRNKAFGHAPFATGDAKTNGWAPTNLGVYGSSWVGFLGALVRPTNNTNVLQLNCLATDFYHAAAYPTYLYYNPWPSAVWINVTVGTNASDLYDCVSKSMLRTNITGMPNFSVPANGSVQLVVLPHGYSWTYNGHQALYNGIVADYLYNE